MEIDLNLLRVFDTLFELRSVTRAADRLGITQSAVSHALARLRRALGDPLFVRGPAGLRATARAETMAAAVREGLHRLRGAVAPARFEPHARRRFTIAASHYFCALLVPALIHRMQRTAPAVSLRVVPVDEALAGALDRGSVDLAFGTFTRMPGRFDAETLYEEEMVWVAAADHPLAAAPFDAARMLARPRVSIIAPLIADVPQPIDGTEGVSQLVAAGAGLSVLDDGVTVYDSQTAIAVAGGSDLVALVPRRMAARDPAVAVLGPSGGASTLPIRMLWHVRQNEDAGLTWLRAQVRAAVDEDPPD